MNPHHFDPAPTDPALLQAAIAAMQGLCANHRFREWSDAKVADMAVKQAQALLARLEG